MVRRYGRRTCFDVWVEDVARRLLRAWRHPALRSLLSVVSTTAHLCNHAPEQARASAWTSFAGSCGRSRRPPLGAPPSLSHLWRDFWLGCANPWNVADHGAQLQLALNVSRGRCSPMGAGSPAPLRLDNVACRQALARGYFRTPIPSLCHPAPSGLAFRIACEFGHKLAFGGVSQKLLRRMHRVITLPGAPTPLYHSPYKGVTEKGKA